MCLPATGIMEYHMRLRNTQRSVMQSTLLFGDIHGCREELHALWEQLDPVPGTRLVFLGDLIDRGPDSPGVVDFVMALSQHYPVTVVRGNHEARALRRYRQGMDPGEGLLPHHLEFLSQSVPFYSFENGRFLAVHGGIYPDFWNHLSQLPELDEREHWPQRVREWVERFYFCRYVNPEGQIVGLGLQRPEDHFWADVYDGRAGLVFFGHEPFFHGPMVFPHAISLDTGCPFGGRLTAARIDEQGRISFVSVTARQAYSPYINYGTQVQAAPGTPLSVVELAAVHSNSPSLL